MENETAFACDVAFADAAQQEAQRAAEKPLEHGPRRKPGNDGDAENGCPEEFGRAEPHGEFGHGRRQENQGESPHSAADQGGNECGVQSFLRPALLGHGIAVKQCGNGSGRPGDAQQNSRNGAARHGGGIDRAQQEQGRHRRHIEGKGHQQGHGHGRAQTRHGAEEKPAEGTANKHQKVGPGQDVG